MLARFSLAALLLLSAPALAQQTWKPDDRVTLELASEGYVETQTAAVTVAFDTAQDAIGLNDARERLRKILKDMVPNGEWRFTRLDRSFDPAGLERWRVQAEARLTEKDLAGLADKAKQQSKPGLQVRVAAIDFTPTLAEREAVLAKLRGEIYKDALAEVARLKAAVPGREYRVVELSFQPVEHVDPRMAKLAMAPPPARPGISPEQAVGEDAIQTAPAVARRIELRGTLVIGSAAP